MASFDLIDEPWIPVVTIAGETRLMGIRPVLLEAPAVRAVADPSPLVTASVYRLLLAVVHRVFGPENESTWESLWIAGAFDGHNLNSYLDQATTREEFDLFHPVRPFYGTTEVSEEYAQSIAKLNFETGPMNATLFAGTTGDVLTSVTPAESIRIVLAYQSFSPAGLFPHEAGRVADKYAKAAPLSKGAITMVYGDTLFATLLLNLHQYNKREPFPWNGEDLPAWEQETPARVEERLPLGYLDWLTWQSRRIRLLPETDESGATVVRRAVYMQGRRVPEGTPLRTFETMVAFRPLPKAKPGTDPYVPVNFTPDRAVWRDSLTIFAPTNPAVIEAQTHRPRTLDWLGNLVDIDKISGGAPRPLELFGVCLDQFNVLFWRHESLPLPLTYLAAGEDGKQLRALLRIALEIAEGTAGALRRGAQQFAEQALTAGERSPDRALVAAMAEGLAPTRVFWAQLESRFARFLQVQAGAHVEASETGQLYSAVPLRAWAGHVQHAGRNSFAATVSNRDTSARTLRAATYAERTFERGLAIALKPVQPQKEMQSA